MSQETYAQWSILELLGHRRLAGFVTEEEIAGKGFLRIEIPGPNGKSVTQFYSPDSVYGLTPTTEEVARRTAALGSPAPVSAWELKLPASFLETKDEVIERMDADFDDEHDVDTVE